MRLIVHTDDFGASYGVTETILDAFDSGIVHSTSIIPNGVAFDYAITEYKKRKGLQLGVHLNLVEGVPLLPREGVTMLVDRYGKFCHSFLSLWAAYLLGNRQIRKTLRAQVKNELSAQITRVKSCARKDFVLHIDSHQHLHLIPFVFDAIIELSRDFNIEYVRMPQEVFFWFFKGVIFFKIYCGLNIVKYLFLNILTARCKKILRQKKIGYCAYFVGVLFSGYMSEDVVKSALAKIPVRNELNSVIEILFHPGRALPEEEIIWRGNRMLTKHYCSLNRTYELQELKKDSFKNFLQLYGR